MKRNTLKLIGLGFLTSALITGGFEIFARGNMPIKGITIQSIFNNNEDKIVEQESLISSLEQENSSLNDENNSLADSIEKHKKTILENEKKIEALDKEVNDLKLKYIGEDAVNQNPSENNNSGTFTINSGETSSDIASRLQAEGYIQSAQDFQTLIDTWQLQQYIQSNSYQLSSDMSMDEILSIITNGAYYY